MDVKTEMVLTTGDDDRVGNCRKSGGELQDGDGFGDRVDDREWIDLGNSSVPLIR